MKKSFKFYTQYNQFYIHDKNFESDTSSIDFWDDQSFFQRLAIGKGILGVATQSYGYIKGEIEIIPFPPQTIDFEIFDHVVEVGLEIKSGELQLSDCPNTEIEIKIKIDSGNYRARIYSSNFESVLETDLDHDTDNDFYRIEIWASEDMTRSVLKQYEG